MRGHGAPWVVLPLLAVAPAAAGCDERPSVAAPLVDPRPLPPRVAYAGPGGSLAGRVELRARARARSGRVVAVTFTLDGRPLGSDTTRPYALDLDAAALGPGRLRAHAVDSHGGRAASRPVAVRPRGRRLAEPVLRASPQRGLGRALAALRAGDVTVRLGPGRYALQDVSLGSGARLVGAGPRTVIAAAGGGYLGLLVAHGQGIRVSDLALDGGGPGPGEGNAVAIFDGSRDVRLQRLQITDVRRHGVTAWGSHAEVSLQDSSIDGGGRADAGVLLLGSDASRDGSVIRTRIRGFRHYGVNFVQPRFGAPRAAARSVALDNSVRDVSDPTREDGTSEGGIWSGGARAALIGNSVARTGWDGIQTVGTSTGVTVVDNRIRATRTGIYLEHSTNGSLIARNDVRDVRTGINVEWRYGGVGSSRNTFAYNRVTGAREAGLFIDVGSNGNRVVGNLFAGGPLPAIRLQGASANRVEANRGCGSSDGALVGEQHGRHDDGRLAVPRDNAIAANDAFDRCPP